MWKSFIQQQQAESYFQEMKGFVQQQRSSGKAIFPSESDVFSAFDSTPFESIKVVILGQDPYHGPNQAHGLAFSVQKGVKIPPSLRNIYKELQTDIKGFGIPSHGNLSAWAEQGVLLLNTVLTVEQGKAHSHAKIGWETFTDHVIDKINHEKSGVVFLLWGSHAQKKGAGIDPNKHHVLTAPHPSPLSAHRGFFGCRHFSQVNEILAKTNQLPIQWQIEE